jgi:hypothetical protein
MENEQVVRIKKINALSAANTAALLAAILGFFFGIIFAVIVLSLGAIEQSAGFIQQASPITRLSARIGLTGIFLFPIIFSINAWFSGLITAFCYNIIAKLTKGIKVSLILPLQEQTTAMQSSYAQASQQWQY